MSQTVLADISVWSVKSMYPPTKSAFQVSHSQNAIMGNEWDS